MEELIYWRHPTVPGIKVEEISGGEGYDSKLWLELARQLYCENGRGEYREIGHYSNGAPFLYGEPTRISITHCRGLFAVATLAATPDANLSEFSEHTALGIDSERQDRSQVLKLRQRFLNADELAMIPADDLRRNIQAWTIKEAVYKAALHPGLDFRANIRIKRLPDIGPAVPVFDPKEFGLASNNKQLPERFFGEVESENLRFSVYTYLSDDVLISLAYLPQSARLGTSALNHP